MSIKPRLLVRVGIIAAISLLVALRFSHPPRLAPPAPRPTVRAPSITQQPAPEEPRSTKLPIYEIKMARNDIGKFEHSAYSNETVPATFAFDGKTYDDVTVRYRGAWARGWPKKPVKIFFSKEKSFEGRHCLNLNSSWRDPAFIREPFAYHIYAACGALAPTCQVVQANLNGQFRGVYVEVEQPAKSFLKRLDLKKASIYKANSRFNNADERDLGTEKAFANAYEKETQKESGCEELQRFCHGLATTQNTAAFFKEHVDIPKYVNFLAASALLQNWDGLNKNHFILYDGEGSKKWFIIPWDLDRTLGDSWSGTFSEARLPLFLGIRESPGVTGWNRMQDHFLREPEFRALFLKRLEQLLQAVFTSEKLFPILDQYERDFASDVHEDARRWPGPGRNMHEGIQEVKGYIQNRRAFLLGEVARNAR